MRLANYLTEQQRLDESLDEFLDMIHQFFSDFASDVKRLGKHMLEPWVAKIDIMKMKRDGWKVVRHSNHRDHELWLMKKGDEEKIMGY
jgi:hypothetical protein